MKTICVELESRFRLTAEGIPVMGKGPQRLLREVERCGSLREAAKKMGMAYSKAWTVIKRSEKALGFSFLCRKTGGTSGGGSLLTQEGRIFLETYENFEQATQAAAAHFFKDYFGKYEFEAKPKS